MASDDGGALIVTARFDPAAQDFFQAMRDRHFPPERNVVPAHCTLFHKLPGARRDELADILAAHAGEAPLAAHCTDLMRFATGGAFRVESAGLSRLRAVVAERFEAVLTRQDSQPFRAHVTYQNKVDPKLARHTFAQVERAFEPFPCAVAAIEMWFWRGGPWEAAGRVALSG